MLPVVSVHGVYNTNEIKLNSFLLLPVISVFDVYDTIEMKAKRYLLFLYLMFMIRFK
jgi:hypothetical protein